MSNIVPIFGFEDINDDNSTITNRKGVIKMTENNYVSKEELNHLEEKLDLKLQNIDTKIAGNIETLKTSMDGRFTNIETKIDGKFSTLDEKFNTFNEKIEKMFLQQKADISKERKENIKWIIGTGIAIVGVIVAALALFPQFS